MLEPLLVVSLLYHQIHDDVIGGNDRGSVRRVHERIEAAAPRAPRRAELVNTVLLPAAAV
jgi:hypothetical protein